MRRILKTLFSFSAILLMLSFSVHAQEPNSPQTPPVNSSMHEGDGNGDCPERQELREERERIRAEHEQIESEHDTLKVQCMDSKGQDRSACHDKFEALRERADAIRERVKTLHERAEADVGCHRKNERKDQWPARESQVPNHAAPMSAAPTGE